MSSQQVSVLIPFVLSCIRGNVLADHPAMIMSSSISINEQKIRGTLFTQKYTRKGHVIQHQYFWPNALPGNIQTFLGLKINCPITAIKDEPDHYYIGTPFPLPLRES